MQYKIKFAPIPRRMKISVVSKLNDENIDDNDDCAAKNGKANIIEYNVEKNIRLKLDSLFMSIFLLMMSRMENIAVARINVAP